MTISVRERIEPHKLGTGPLFASLQERTRDDNPSLRTLLGHLNATARIRVTLVELFCARTEDYTGDDSLRLEIYTDGRQELVLRTDLNEGETWPLNRHVEFQSQLIAVLYEEDNVDADDVLGHIIVTATDRSSGRYTEEFDSDDALYQFRYAVENPRNDVQMAERTARSFDPTQHSFRFTNSFQIDVTIDFGIPGIEPIGISDSYGLCGGMAQTAKDFFLAEQPIPTDKTVPNPPSVLYYYIYGRQLDSFGELLEYIFKFIDWHGESRSRIEARTLSEWADVRRRLDYGELVMLGLLYTDAESLWDNHQVLAYGYRENPQTRTTSILVYDPNAPAQESRLELRTRENAVESEEHIEGKTKPLNGFFAMNVPTIEPLSEL